MKYPKTVLMPVGVDTEPIQAPAGRAARSRGHTFLCTHGPSKRPDMLLEALHLLNQKGVSFSADFYGTPLPKDDGVP